MASILTQAVSNYGLCLLFIILGPSQNDQDFADGIFKFYLSKKLFCLILIHLLEIIS